MFEMYPDLLTVKETCIALRLCETSVRAKINLGEIKSIRHGRKIVCPKSGIIDYINGQLVSAEGAYPDA